MQSLGSYVALEVAPESHTQQLFSQLESVGVLAVVKTNTMGGAIDAFCKLDAKSSSSSLDTRVVCLEFDALSSRFFLVGQLRVKGRASLSTII